MFQHLRHTWIIALLLLGYVCIQSYCIHQLTSNYDEGLFAGYGVTILKGQRNKDIALYESKLPITSINMLPRAVEQVMHPGLSKKNLEEDITRGRYVSLLVSIILALVIYHWSKLLYGKTAALFSFCFFLLCPNFLAHGIFVSSDIFACLFMTLSFFFLWKFSGNHQAKNIVLASLFVALSEISKFSMVHLFILFPLLLITEYFFCRKNKENKKQGWKQLIYHLLIFIAINWFIISAAHLFYGMFMPLNDYHFKSSFFQNLQTLFHGIGNYLPVPFPSSYIESMDTVLYFDKLGGGMPGSLNGPPYILGKSHAHGFWYYYFVVLFYKLPIPILLLSAAAIFLYFRKPGWKGFFRNEMYLLIPLFYFLIYMNFFYSTQVGIRHIMIILPLLYIFSGFFFYKLNTIAAKLTGLALLIWQGISVGLYFPHFLPYTNEFITNKKMAYKKIADTNLCYGEGAGFLLKYLRENKTAVYLPDKIIAGKIVVDVNRLVNLNIATMHKYDWLRSLEPVSHIHSQYLVFDVSPALADSLQKLHH
ncbi:MAG: glycosyltransferase family 39 protein [Bacteroidota bacterium]